MNCISRLAVAAALCAVSAVSLAQAAAAPPSPEQVAKGAIETRQGLFKVMSAQMGPIAGLLRNQGEFNAAVVGRNAARIQTLSEILPELFANDTRQFKATKTIALDGIWNSQADFKVKAEALTKAAAGVVAAAKTGDKAATQKAAAEIGKACGSCHDSYRAKM
jgi:cytochrome c556